MIGAKLSGRHTDRALEATGEIELIGIPNLGRDLLDAEVVHCQQTLGIGDPFAFDELLQGVGFKIVDG